MTKTFFCSLTYLWAQHGFNAAAQIQRRLKLRFINIAKLGQIKFIEGSLEVKLPTIWRDEEAVSREKSQKRKDQKKEDAGARKGRKVARQCVFPWFCGSGGLKSRLAKAVGAETSGEMRDEKTLHYTPLHYNYNYTTTLHYTKVHYTTLHSTTLHYTILHYTTLHHTE